MLGSRLGWAHLPSERVWATSVLVVLFILTISMGSFSTEAVQVHRGLDATASVANGITLRTGASPDIVGHSQIQSSGSRVDQSPGCVPAGAATEHCSAGPSKRSTVAGDVYEGWGNLTPYLSRSPSPRWAAAMAYDANASDQYVVLFGGMGTHGALADTWIFQDGSWINVTPSTPNVTNSPSPRYGAAMAFDSADGYLVLYGGASSSFSGSADTLLDDTWEFEHGRWTRLCSSCTPGNNEPGARLESSISDDPQDHGVLSFGGLSAQEGNPAVLNDTWLFRNGMWSQLTPPMVPGGRYGAEMSLVPSNGANVLFGGCASPQLSGGTGCGAFLGDTWTYSGGIWREAVDTQGGPGSRMSFGLTSASSEDSVLAFGGVSPSGYLDDTWQFQNGSWTNLAPSLITAPSVRDGVGLAYDPAVASDDFVLFGGWNGTYLNETWVYPSPFEPLQVSVPTPSSMVTDAGHPIWLNVSVGGGSGGYNRTWFGLPPGCTTANTSSLLCHPASPLNGLSGSYSVSVRVRDSRGSIVWSPSTSIEVNARPAVALLPLSLNLGAVPWNVTLEATVSGGTPPFVYTWDWADGTNNSSGNPATHQYTAVGNFTVKAWVVDSLGESALSGGLRVRSAPHLSSLLTVSSGMVGLGSQVTFQSYASGGVPPYSYTWYGLPTSCPELDAATISCSPAAYGTYIVTVQVNDSVGDRSTSSTTLVVSSTLPFGLFWGAVIVALIVVAAAAVWFARKFRRKRALPIPSPPAGP